MRKGTEANGDRLGSRTFHIADARLSGFYRINRNTTSHYAESLYSLRAKLVMIYVQIYRQLHSNCLYVISP